MELEPDFASAYGMAARCYAFRTANGWMTDPAMDADEVGRLCRRVMELGQDDAVALCTAGHALSRVVGDTDAGSRLIDRALELNPNLGAVLSSPGLIPMERWSGNGMLWRSYGR